MLQLAVFWFLPSVISVSESIDESVSGSYCRCGWRPAMYIRTQPQNVCFKIFHDKSSWETAWRTCHSQHAVLYNSDGGLRGMRQPFETLLADYAQVKGLGTTFWTGLHEKYDRLRADGYPTQITLKASFLDDWKWKLNEPSRFGKCVQMTLSEVLSARRGLMEHELRLSMKNCATMMPFVCVSNWEFDVFHRRDGFPVLQLSSANTNCLMKTYWESISNCSSEASEACHEYARVTEPLRFINPDKNHTIAFSQGDSISCSMNTDVNGRNIVWIRDGTILHQAGVISTSSSSYLQLQWDKNNFTSVTGYYWCEYLDHSNPAIIRSQTYLVVLPPEHFYITNVHLRPNNIQLTYQSCWRYWLLKDFSNLSNKESLYLDILTKQIEEVSTLNVRLKIIDMSCRNVDVKFQVYFELTNGYVSSSAAIWKSVQPRVLPKNTFPYAKVDYILEHKYAVCKNFTWREIPDVAFGAVYPGETAYSNESCMADHRPLASVQCKGNFYTGRVRWERVIINDRCDYNNLTISPVSSTLRKLIQERVTGGQDLLRIGDILQKLTRVTYILKTIDVLLVTDQLEEISNTDYIPIEGTRMILNIISNLMCVSQSTLEEAERKSLIAQRLLRIIDRIGIHTDLGGERYTTIKTPNIAMAVADMDDLDDLVLGMAVEDDDSRTIDDYPITLSNQTVNLIINQTEEGLSKSRVSILLPKEYIKKLFHSGTEKLRVCLHTYSGRQLFLSKPQGNISDLEVNSQIISATLSVNKTLLTNLGGYQVRTAFLPYQGHIASVTGLFVEEAGVPRENHRAVTSTCQISNIVSMNFGTVRVRVVEDMRTIDVKYASACGVIVPLCRTDGAWMVHRGTQGCKCLRIAPLGFTVTRLQASEIEAVCAYWKYSSSPGLTIDPHWATDGCFYNKTIDDRHVCYCDHLTNFAILLDAHGQMPIDADHKLALSIITIAGLVTSILMLSLTIVSFIVFRKLRQGKMQHTLLNLSISLACSYLVFLAGINETGERTLCMMVAVVLHYLILVSFMWMLVEASLQYIYLIRVFNTYIPRFIPKAIILSWGLPLLPPAVTLGIDPTLYKGGELYCWMSSTAFYYAFAIPVGLILIVNFCIYVCVVFKLCRRSNAGLRSTQPQCKIRKTNVKSAFSVFILLGLTWMFRYLQLIHSHVVFSYIFTVLNVFHGLLIFLLFVARRKEFRQYWRMLLSRRSTHCSHTREMTVVSSATCVKQRPNFKT